MPDRQGQVDVILERVASFDPSGEASLHRALSQWMLETLQLDSVPDGTRIPSERDLAGALRVSRMTVRRALEYVTGEGLIHREIGSRIWRVRKRPRIEINVAQFSGFTSQLLESGVTVTTSLVRVEERHVTTEEAREFGLPHDTTVFEVARVRDASGEPVLLERFTIPTSIAPGLAEQNLSGSIYQVLREEYGLNLARATHRILASSLHVDEAELLGRRPGMAVLRLHRQTYDATGRLVELADDILCSDRISVVTESALR